MINNNKNMKIYKNLNTKVFHHNHQIQANLKAQYLASAVNPMPIQPKKKGNLSIKI